MFCAVELGKKIQQKEISVVEATKEVLSRIKEVESTYHSFITIDEEGALEQAKKVQASNLNTPLAGVPMAIKDNICTKNMRTTCGSRMLENFIPCYDATVVEILRKQGAIIIGKTNMDEFAMGSTTENSAFGVTKNPWNVEHVCGGSSGGSASALALGECFYSLGSDTGGSIVQPSGYCGIVGMKPTYGTVSRYGLVAYASSLEQIGPMARTVTDCATILQQISVYDKKDSTCIKRDDTDFIKALVTDIKGIRIGIPRAYFADGLEEETKVAILNAVRELEKQGAIVEEFDLELTKYAVSTYYTIACAEASSNLARFDGVKYGYRSLAYEGMHEMYKKSRSEGFGTEVKRRIMLGTFVLSAGYYEDYYLKALKTRALIKQQFDKAFEKYDVLVAPVSSTTAPKLGELIKDPMKMYLSDLYTVSTNLAGLPAMSVPCGMDKNGLPIGMQLIGNCFEEKKLLRVAYTLEQIRK